jgi:hypothetical protein
VSEPNDFLMGSDYSSLTMPSCITYLGNLVCQIWRPPAAQRRRSMRGRAHKPVGAHPHLRVVGVGDPMAMPCMSRLVVRLGESVCFDPRDQQLSGSLGTEGFKNIRCTLPTPRQDFLLG